MLRKILIVDLTHGGTKLATEFSKISACDVFALDIYQTLKDHEKEDLRRKGVKLVDEEFLKQNSVIKTGKKKGNDIMVVAPIHCKLEYPVDMSHHEAVAFLMESRIDVPVIEVTGVKGKTTVVHMLGEIFKDLNPLLLSSLGVEILANGKVSFLEKDLSITPANIIKAWEMGQKYDPGIFIVETSLGGTGLAQVGILTNIAEDYSIASGRKTASQAKAQIFKNNLIVCDSDSSSRFYPQFREKTNTFCVDGEGDVKASRIIYGLHETVFKVEVSGLKTVSGEFLKDEFQIKTFAPTPYHVENVLSAICASLTYGIAVDVIKDGLERFHGLKGRTSLKTAGGACIIEEINPGINLTTIKKSLEMIEGLGDSTVVFGGKYGVTCEEIDEKSAAMVLNELNEDVGLILTDELGEDLKEMIKRNYNYFADFAQAVDHAQKRKYQNILLIYRSNFPDILHR